MAAGGERAATSFCAVRSETAALAVSESLDICDGVDSGGCAVDGSPLTARYLATSVTTVCFGRNRLRFTVRNRLALKGLRAVRLPRPYPHQGGTFMAFPGGYYRSTASGGVSPRGSGVVFAIGRHVFVACPSEAAAVTLTDDSGATPCGKLRRGAEVEILAWRPRGPLGTRYLVRSPSKGIEGWLGAGDLSGAKHKAVKVAR